MTHRTFDYAARYGIRTRAMIPKDVDKHAEMMARSNAELIDTFYSSDDEYQLGRSATPSAEVSPVGGAATTVSSLERVRTKAKRTSSSSKLINHNS